jgi:hypothetical protein
VLNAELPLAAAAVIFITILSRDNRHHTIFLSSMPMVDSSHAASACSIDTLNRFIPAVTLFHRSAGLDASNLRISADDALASATAISNWEYPTGTRYFLQ